MIVIVTAVSDAKDATMIVIILVKGCDDDSYQGTSSDAEDVVRIGVMTRMITIITPARAIILMVITPVPLSSWSSSSLIRQHW